MTVVRDGMGGQMRLVHKFQDRTSEVYEHTYRYPFRERAYDPCWLCNGNKSEIRTTPSGVYTHNFYWVNGLEG